MPYQLLINGNPIMTGDVGLAAIVIVIILGIIVLLVNFIWHKLRENEKMKYEFITIIAHKFRTPLTQIKWLLETLIPGEQEQYKQESLGEIKKANENLIKMTGSLVEITDTDAATASSYALEKTNVCEFVRIVSDNFKNAFHEKNLFFSVQCEATEIFIEIDKPRMEFVLQTLIENAITYSPPGRNIKLTVTQIKKTVAISIIDDGIGIDGRDISHIFKKFFRAQNAKRTDTEGFGVGLFLAAAVVRRHKGKITVYSEGINKGSTFSVVLPLAS